MVYSLEDEEVEQPVQLLRSVTMILMVMLSREKDLCVSISGELMASFPFMHMSVDLDENEDGDYTVTLINRDDKVC